MLMVDVSQYASPFIFMTSIVSSSLHSTLPFMIQFVIRRNYNCPLRKVTMPASSCNVHWIQCVWGSPIRW